MKYSHVKVPLIMQMEYVECGAASLAMILACYGKYVPLEQVRRDCGVSRDGARASNLVTAAKTSLAVSASASRLHARWPKIPRC